MEDVSSKRTIAHGSSRFALIVVVAGLAIGDVAVVRAVERAASSKQAASAAHLFPPKAVAPGFVNLPETLQTKAVLAAPISRPAGARIDAANDQARDVSPHQRSVTGTASFTPQRLVEQAAEHLSKAEASLRRQATYSAKASAIDALRLIAEARDYAHEQTTAAEQLREGLTAIRESSDFMGRYGPIDPDDISRMVEAHVTATLKETDATSWNGASAADRYLSTARGRLASVAGGNPIATRALVVLAEIYRQEKALGPHADAIAVNLLRAALQSTPSDPALANELGFLLMKQGILGEAQWALEHSMAIAPTASAAQNLAEVMRQRGNLQGASELVALLDDSRGFLATPAQRLKRPTVETLTPAQFAALSRPHQPFAPSATGSFAAPPASPPSARAVGAGEAFVSADPPAPQSKPAIGPVGRVAKAVSGWFQ